MKMSEKASQLNQYAKEITADLAGEPDEETGFLRTHLLLGDFLVSRSQPTVLVSYIDMSNIVAIDAYEPFSKDLVVERMINSVQDMIDLLERSKKRLEVIAGKTPARVQ